MDDLLLDASEILARFSATLRLSDLGDLEVHEVLTIKL